jgi:carboxyl-terminal processing protease
MANWGAGLVLALGAAAMAPAQTPVLPATLANADFESAASGAPSQWVISHVGGGHDYQVETVAGEHGRAARLFTRTPAARGGAMLSQTIDAAPWRGKDIEVSARVRIEGASRVGLPISVARPKLNDTGYRDQSGLRDVASDRWVTVRRLAHVDDDALVITLGVGLAGAGAVLVDDVAVTEAVLPAEPPSAEALAYLDRALAFMRAEHMRTREMDWPALEARAHRQIVGAKGPADTYWAIRSVLGTLGDHHSFLTPPPRPGTAKPGPAAQRPSPAAVVTMPATRLVEERVGLIALPALDTFGPDGAANGARYAATARAGLKALDARPLCGWIIDLRGNGGGDMWPMLNGVSALLGPGPYGAFVTPDGKVSRWVMSPIGVVVEGTEAGDWPHYARFALRQASRPLAVLTGPGTASSGEAVAVAFAGRARIRRFGEPTAGFSSGNSTQVLSDGAVLGVASVWERDRTGREYRNEIAPDEAVPVDAAEAAAVAWLGRQCVTRRK